MLSDTVVMTENRETVIAPARGSALTNCFTEDPGFQVSSSVLCWSICFNHLCISVLKLQY